MFAVLLGGNEAGPTGHAPVGDLDGAGYAAVSLVAADQLCFTILVNHLDQPAMAHIHQGPAGTNGPIVINLTPPVHGEQRASAGCVVVGPTCWKGSDARRRSSTSTSTRGRSRRALCAGSSFRRSTTDG